MTPEQVETFQRTHRNHLGQPLVVDGDPGPQTRWAMAVISLCHARQMIVRAAQQHLGLVEVPVASNDDPAGIIRAWLERCRAQPGDPWCAAAASWCLSQGLPTQVREGGAERLGKRFPPTLAPVAGDLFWYPVGPRQPGGHQPAHVGVVGGADEREVMTFEGNCQNAYRITRRARAGLNFSRTVSDVSGNPPGIVPSVALAPGATR